MESVVTASVIVIGILCGILEAGKSIMQKDLNDIGKIIILSVLNFLVYCLLLYAYGFIQWTIRLNKFNQYPYRNPFNMLVILYCIIFFIILGVYCIKYAKSKYDIGRTIVFLLFTHILAILFVFLLEPLSNFF